jgi:magnesium chelatase subunit D
MPGRATDESKGRGDATPSPTGRGATVRTERTDDTGSTDAAATVRAAARNGRSSPTEGDLRRSVRADDARTLTVFVADASASMAPAMRTAKGVVLELLGDAYAERDAVALVAVGGDDAEVLLPPTTDVSLAARHLKDLPTADRTPLPAGLDAATDLIEREEPAGALVVLVSDGRANVADGSPTAATRAAARRLGGTDASVLVVDAGEPRAGLLDAVCGATDADRIPLSALSTAAVADQSSVVRER